MATKSLDRVDKQVRHTIMADHCAVGGPSAKIWPSFVLEFPETITNSSRSENFLRSPAEARKMKDLIN